MEEKLGHRIRAARKRLGWTQEKLASESDVKRVHIARVETGRGRFSIGNLQKIARALGVGMDELTGTFEKDD